jgi:hypothetical protein
MHVYISKLHGHTIEIACLHACVHLEAPWARNSKRLSACMLDLAECSSHARSWGVITNVENQYVTVALDLRPETCVLPVVLRESVTSNCRTSYRLRSDKYHALMHRLHRSCTVDPVACARKIWLMLHRYHALFGPSGEHPGFACYWISPAELPCIGIVYVGHTVVLSNLVPLGATKYGEQAHTV